MNLSIFNRIDAVVNVVNVDSTCIGNTDTSGLAVLSVAVAQPQHFTYRKSHHE